MEGTPSASLDPPATVTFANDDERFEKFYFLDQSTALRAIVIFLVSFRTLEDLLDGLEKSQARAASFPFVPNFIVGFMCANPVDRDEQLPVGHVSRLFRASPLSFLAILSAFFPRRTRLSSSWLLVRTSVCLAVRACLPPRHTGS